MRKARRAPRNLLTGIAALAAAVAVGCGGDSSESPSPPPPVGGGSASQAVGEQTEGRLGQATRVTPGKEDLLEGEDRISAEADRPTDAQKNGVAAAAQCADSETTPSSDNLGAMAASVLCLVNAERADQGLGALAQNGQLDQAAQGMANEMVEKTFFSHDTPDGRNLADRVQPTGYLPRNDEWVIGENLAWGSGALSTPRAIVNGWMNSEGHRKNVLDSSYRDIGLGTRMGSPSPNATGGTVFVHNFGARGAGLAGGSAESAGTGADSGANPAVAGARTAATRRAALRRCRSRARKAKTSSSRRKAARRCVVVARRASRRAAAARRAGR